MNKVIRVNERTLNVTDITDDSQANIESMGIVVGKGKEDLADSLRLVGKRCNRLLTDIDKHVRLRHRYFETLEDKELYYSLEPTYNTIIAKDEELRTDDEKVIVIQFEAIPTVLEAEEWNDRIGDNAVISATEKNPDITESDILELKETAKTGVINYITLLEQMIAASELSKSEL